MDEIRCEIRLSEVEGKPARLVGVLMPFGEQSRDRAEVFERGSLKWDKAGIVLNRMHRRDSPILRFVPVEVDGKLTIDTAIPSTSAGVDAREEIKSGLLTGLSVEFRSVKQTFLGGVRRISEAILSGAGLVDSASYFSATATVEARAIAERQRWRELVL